jgi:hypothetical protein
MIMKFQKIGSFTDSKIPKQAYDDFVSLILRNLYRYE